MKLNNDKSLLLVYKRKYQVVKINIGTKAKLKEIVSGVHCPNLPEETFPRVQLAEKEDFPRVLSVI